MATRSKVLIALATVCLVVFNVTTWLAFDVFNSQRFGRLVVEVVRDDEVVAAITDEIVNTVLAERPVLAGVMRAPAQEVVGYLVAQPLFERVVEGAASSVHTVITRGAPGQLQDKITVDLGAVVPVLTALVGAVQPEAGAGLAQATARLSEGIEVVQTSQLPNLRRVAQIVPLVWPFAGLLTFGLFGYVLATEARRRAALKWSGLAVMGAGLFQLLVLPAGRVVATGRVVDPLGLTIVNAVYSVLIRDFQVLSLCAVLVGLLGVALSRSDAIAGWADRASSPGS